MADKNYLHTAYAYSADGTDRFTPTYPNLNLLEDGKFAKPVSSKWMTDGTTISKDDITGYFKVIFNGTGSYNRAYYVAGISNIPIGEKYSVYIKAYSLEDSLNIKIGTVNTSQAVTVTKNGNIPKIYKVEGLVRGTSDAFGIFGGLTTTLGTLFISEIKLEEGSTATPYMPSSSEATTADWPKYVGTYVDTNPVSSTNSSKYVWDEIKYRVYLDGVPVGGSKLLSFDLENLKAGTSYDVQVSQINGNDESDKSESVAFKTLLTN
ncbi:fibronectin type III domain-containing protein [Lactococcus lactis]|uniref:fibronectin type III domain-containing protein n=1 Tax=Lactococcus lactis TaxID=1358 RepID=UPI00207376DC|nr:fibronectin type III domain-containing protein [Lactococcus lactis]